MKKIIKNQIVNKNIKTNRFLTQPIDSGRSMVEMLGVLAIIGVLSVGGIQGYRYAMDKYKANQTMQDINLRMTTIKGQLALEKEISLEEFNDSSSLGYMFNALEETEDGSILLSIQGLEQRVCNLVKDGMPEYEIIVNDSLENTECLNSDGNKLAFIVGEDLNGEEIDNVNCDSDRDCSGDKHLCINNKCEACPDVTPKWNGDSCEACPDTMPKWNGNSCEACPEGKSYWKEGNECVEAQSCVLAPPSGLMWGHMDKIYCSNGSLYTDSAGTGERVLVSELVNNCQPMKADELFTVVTVKGVGKLFVSNQPAAGMNAEALCKSIGKSVWKVSSNDLQCYTPNGTTQFEYENLDDAPAYSDPSHYNTSVRVSSLEPTDGFSFDSATVSMPLTSGNNVNGSEPSSQELKTTFNTLGKYPGSDSGNVLLVVKLTDPGDNVTELEEDVTDEFDNPDLDIDIDIGGGIDIELPPTIPEVGGHSYFNSYKCCEKGQDCENNPDNQSSMMKNIREAFEFSSVLADGYRCVWLGESGGCQSYGISFYDNSNGTIIRSDFGSSCHVVCK